MVLAPGADVSHDDTSVARDPFLSQLLTVLVCAAYGVIAILIYRSDILKYVVLAESMRPIAIAGATLAILALIRATTIWLASGKSNTPANSDHVDMLSEVPPHRTGVVCIQAIILAFPVLLFLCGLPDKSSAEALDTESIYILKKDGIVKTSFNHLKGSALDPKHRELLQGNRITLEGHIRKLSSKQLVLFNLHTNCYLTGERFCSINVLSSIDIGEVEEASHYSINGEIQYMELGSRIVTILRVDQPDDIKLIK